MSISELENLRRTFGVAKRNPCMTHVSMLVDRHWRFCPWCGLKLEIKIDCPTCGRHFISTDAYTVHVNIEHMTFFKKINDEHARAGFTHRLKWMKHTKSVYCMDCQKVLAQQNSWEQWEAEQEEDRKKHKEEGARWPSKNMKAVPEAAVSNTHIERVKDGSD